MSTNNGPVLEFFHENRIALGEEVKLHPELKEMLAAIDSSEIEMKMAEIAAYCDVILDGYYSVEDLDDLSGKLVWKLREKRAAQAARITTTKQ